MIRLSHTRDRAEMRAFCAQLLTMLKFTIFESIIAGANDRLESQTFVNVMRTHSTSTGHSDETHLINQSTSNKSGSFYFTA